MNVLPFLSSVLITSSVAFTHSCSAFMQDTTVQIESQSGKKHIRLLKISPERIDHVKMQSFFRASEKDYRGGITHFSNSSSSVDLGMAGVPVLDQGQFGTCVTFSSTAALDASMQGRGDFISQECSLALDVGAGYGNYWDGANTPSQIIDPLKINGVVSKSGCGAQYPDDSYSITAENYRIVADKAASAQVAQVKYVYSPKSDLLKLKAALKAGHRVLIAFLVDGSNQEAVQGFDVKVDGRKFVGGGWFCKQPGSVNHCVQSNAGHEVLAIGYDDKQQLLKIRNSWSADVGENGEYYMSYTFFNSMSIDQTEVF